VIGVNEATRPSTADANVRVRVWFGHVPIVDYATSHSEAPAQVLGLQRRFTGLPVTIEPDADVTREIR
jgi:hypothetical protein